MSTSDRPILVAPSILAADFARLGEDVKRIESVVDLLHIDVMDGHFVPNISLGIPVIQSLRAVTDLPFDCHLMTTNPDAYLEPLKEAGATGVTVHLEVFPNPTDVARKAREIGLGFGVVVNPATPFEAMDPFLELSDMVLVMSVVPGFGGQSFMPEVLSKISRAREMIDSRGLEVDIEIDGGIGPETIGSARQAGANVFVAGSAIFRQADPVSAVAALRKAMNNEG